MVTEVFEKKIEYFKIIKDAEAHYLFFSGIDGDYLVCNEAGLTLVADAHGLKTIRKWAKQQKIFPDMERWPSMIVLEDNLIPYLMEETADEEAVYVVMMNTYLDGIKPTGFLSNEVYKKALYAFADHMTFRSEYRASFFNDDLASIHRFCDIFKALIQAFWDNTFVFTGKEPAAEQEKLIKRFNDLRYFEEYKT
jgi:hypothetical protein